MSIGKFPENMTSLFKKKSDYHPYSTRIANLYHIPSVKFDITGIRDRGATIWNLIPLEEINIEVSEAVFKKNLIRMLHTAIFENVLSQVNHQQILMTCALFCFDAYDQRHVYQFRGP